ncbi:hypothetical protein GCM10009078_19660 [Cupriavidus gilardii]
MQILSNGRRCADVADVALEPEGFPSKKAMPMRGRGVPAYGTGGGDGSEGGSSYGDSGIQ